MLSLIPSACLLKEVTQKQLLLATFLAPQTLPALHLQAYLHLIFIPAHMPMSS